MSNLSPHWKFRWPAAIKGSMRPFYQFAWPEDLPTQCQICGTGFRMGWNITIGPNRIGRFLRSAAYWSFLPCIFLSPVLSYFFPGMYDGMRSNQAAWLVFFMMFVPPPLFLIASKFTPIARRVDCFKCGWNHDFPRVKPTPIPLAKESP